MSREIPGQTAEVAGPIKAFVIKEPRRAAALIKGAKRPLIIVGDLVTKYDTEDFNGIDIVIQIAKEKDAHINVTGPLIKKFRETGYKNLYFMPALEVIDRLMDKDWSGHDGKGKYDLIIFIGFMYYYEWLMLNGLKHFAYKWLKTLSLDPYYHPNATFTLLTMKIDDWRKFIKEIVNFVRG